MNTDLLQFVGDVFETFSVAGIACSFPLAVFISDPV